MKKNQAGIVFVLLFLLALPNYFGFSKAKASVGYSTTVTIYPSFDGDIGTNFNQSYAAAHNTADCLDCSSGGIITTENSIGQYNGVFTYSVIRSALNFDTSFLGANAQILSATFSVKPTNVHFDYTFSDFIRLTSNSIASPTSLTLNDYGSFGSSAMAGDFPVSALVTNQYAAFPLNEAGLAAINKTSVFRFALRSGLDVNAQQPVAGTDESFPNNGGTVVFFQSSETVGLESDPKLVITYESGSQFAAAIVASAINGNAPLVVNFSIDANQTVSSVIWKLNSVEFSQLPAPSLTFTTAGNYRIDAIVSSGNATVTATIFITVTSCTCK